MFPGGSLGYVRLVVALIAQVADAAHALHEAGILHRDIKPGNVMVSPDGERATLMVLGLAKFLDEAGDGVTNTRGFVGTARYASPEQVAALGGVDRRADVYGLGATLWELLTLRPIHGADQLNEQQLMQRVLRKPADRVQKHHREVPQELDAIVGQGLERDPDARYPTAKALADDLRNWLNGKPVQAMIAHRRSRMRVVALAGLFLAVATVVLGRPRDRSPSSDVGQLPPPVGEKPKTPPDPQPPVTEPLKPGEVRKFTIADGVFMEFCWIPPGEAQLGSPTVEQDYITKTYFDGKRPGFLDDETEAKRRNYKTDGFWLGKYEVTQAEWKAVMSYNPSYFDGKKSNMANGKDTNRFPVDGVSWNECSAFLAVVNKRPGVVEVFGGAGKFRLPNDDEWEYACRGGAGNGRAFYWGGELNGTQANCDGNFPFGAAAKGQVLGRPCAVDDTNGGKYEQHPWGLCGMHGNVQEWCYNEYGHTGDHFLRGGSWNSVGRSCRSASRNNEAPDYRDEFTGFRVFFSHTPAKGKKNAGEPSSGRVPPDLDP